MNRREQAKKLSEMLQSLMSDRGWNARELARQSDIPPSTMINYVNGMSFPNKEARELLSRHLFGLSIDEFDKIFGLTTLPKPKTDDICRDIRLLDSDEFQIVARVVFDRVLAEMQNQSSSS